jgi:hypothetical protein
MARILDPPLRVNNPRRMYGSFRDKKLGARSGRGRLLGINPGLILAKIQSDRSHCIWRTCEATTARPMAWAGHRGARVIGEMIADHRRLSIARVGVRGGLRLLPECQAHRKTVCNAAASQAQNAAAISATAPTAHDFVRRIARDTGVDWAAQRSRPEGSSLPAGEVNDRRLGG